MGWKESERERGREGKQLTGQSLRYLRGVTSAANGSTHLVASSLVFGHTFQLSLTPSLASSSLKSAIVAYGGRVSVTTKAARPGDCSAATRVRETPQNLRKAKQQAKTAIFLNNGNLSNFRAEISDFSSYSMVEKKN